ncbi:MAG: hypothetical protein LUG83_00270 [Lachnospiraceae bacterium]|nr:hypothetical protein [Lachnospiraceae bacterium]
MSAKTKIVVLHMKELIYTGIFAALGILFILLFIFMFLPDKNDEQSDTESEESSEQSAETASESIYIPGVYTTELVLAGESIDVEVIVDDAGISSVRLVNLSDTITTMYPLLEPTFASICEQLYQTQNIEQVTYTSDSKYTSLVLLEAINSSLEKALIP